MEEPSELQKQAIPPIMKGRDVLVQAQAGTGKTASYVISILQMIEQQNSKIQALVLVPTRELAIAISRVFETIGTYLKLTTVTCFGGIQIKDIIEKIKRGGHILVGTPGRIADMINRGIICVDDIRMLVMDELDELIDRGFVEQVNEIMKAIPETTQV